MIAALVDAVCGSEVRTAGMWRGESDRVLWNVRVVAFGGVEMNAPMLLTPDAADQLADRMMGDIQFLREAARQARRQAREGSVNPGG